jgi:hypothetical protein
MDYRVQVLGVDDDLLGSVERPERFVEKLSLHSRPGLRRRPQLDRVSCHLSFHFIQITTLTLLP